MIKKIFTFLFYLLLLSYVGWEIYWFNQVGLTFIKWHTHLAVPFLLFLIFYHIFKLFRVAKKWINVLFTVFTAIFLFEFLVQITGLGKTPLEKEYGVYFSWKERNNHYQSLQNYYWINKPYSIKKLFDKDLFYYERKMNSLGYSDVEWKKEKDTNEVRILCLGDSFTEGDGTPFDSTYVAFLRRMVKRSDITFMNAGKCGSDPFFNFMNYKDRLQEFSPDIILQTISTQDLLFDIPQRGGLERFEESHLLKFQYVNPFLEFVYAISYTSRPIFYLLGYNEEVQKSKTVKDTQKMLSFIDDFFKDYDALVQKRTSKLKVIVFPLDREVFDGYEQITQETITLLDNRCEIIDLRPYIKQKIVSEDRIYDYYWKGDGHFNSKGYQLMAEAIYEKVFK